MEFCRNFEGIVPIMLFASNCQCQCATVKYIPRMHYKVLILFELLLHCSDKAELKTFISGF